MNTLFMVLFSSFACITNAFPSASRSFFLPQSSILFRNQFRVAREYREISISTPLFMGKPKSGSIVDSYQTVSVNCKKCRTRLFRYKKKNGTKSNLIKCYIERISEDCVDLVAKRSETPSGDNAPLDWFCPNCKTRFGKDSMIHGRPAIKLVGGKTSMTKK